MNKINLILKLFIERGEREKRKRWEERERERERDLGITVWREKDTTDGRNKHYREKLHRYMSIKSL